MRYFDTGATRDDEGDKLDYEGFLSPYVLKRFAEYMHEHRKQADDVLRDSDNWQKGIPMNAYMKSLWRHFMDVWMCYRAKDKTEISIEDALCATLFNVQGMLHEILTGAVIPFSELQDVTELTKGTDEVEVYYSTLEPHQSGFHTHPKQHGWESSHLSGIESHDLFNLHYHIADDDDHPVVYRLKPGEEPVKRKLKDLGEVVYDERLGASAPIVFTGNSFCNGD